MTDKQIDEAHISVLKLIRERDRLLMDHTDPECPHGIAVSALNKAIAALERQRTKPTDEHLNGLARDIVMWMSFAPPHTALAASPEPSDPIVDKSQGMGPWTNPKPSGD